MANVKISELTAITSSDDLADADIVPIVDSSDSTTKRTALSVLCSYFGGGGGGSSVWCTGTNTAYLLTDCVGIGTATPGTDIMFRVQGDSCYTGDLKIGGDVCIGGDDLFMNTNTSGYMLIADGTNFNPVAMSGDVAIDSAGATTIQATSVDNSMLAGSIANAKLSNDSVSYGGVSVDLGATDATPAFNLCDATAYKGDSALVTVGTIANGTWNGTAIANGYLANSSITLSDGSNTTAISLGGTMTFSGTSNEIEVAESSGTVTIGLPVCVTGLTTVCATNFAGTLATAAQTNVTSLGTLTALTASGNVSFDGGTFVFNESGADLDFRIEGDSDANLLIADASTDRIGIGTATPDYLLSVAGNAGFDEYIYHNGDADTYIRMRGDQFDFVAGNMTFLTLDESSGASADTVTVNHGDNDIDFLVNSDDGTQLIRTDAENNRVGIGTEAPATMLHVQGATCVTGAVNVGGDLTISGDDLIMGTNTSGYLLVADGTNYNPVAVSGDVTINSSGAVTIAATSVENSMLAGSIANAKLSNSSVSYGGVSLSLGGTDATPAFNLCDATAYKGDSALVTVGTVTSGTWQGTAVAAAYVAAAQTNITSLGTLTALTVDNICLDGTTIGHTSDTDLMTLADGVLTVSGRLDAASDIKVDAIRRYSDSSTTTKILLNDEVIKLNAGHASNEVVKIASGAVTIDGDLTICGDDLIMGTNTSGYLLVADGTNYNPVAMSGDIAIDSAGATTIQATSVDNSMLAGSIANDKLSNDSVSFGGISVDLGAADATPAFNLCDATAYKGDSALVTVGTLTALTVSGDVSLDGGSFVFNESAADKDFRIEGDSEANLFVTDASIDRVGIGDATPLSRLDVTGAASANTARIVINDRYNDSATESGIDFYRTYDTGGADQTAAYIRHGRAGGDVNTGLLFGTGTRGAPADRMTITPAGKVGIGLTAPGGKLSIYDSTAADYTALRIYQGGDTDYYWDFTADIDAGDLVIGGNHSSFDLILNPSYGNVGIGTATPGSLFHAEGSTGYMKFDPAVGGNTKFKLTSNSGATEFGTYNGSHLLFFTDSSARMCIETSGAVVISGSLSKGSGSFRIPHPLESRDGYDLVHSFIEGPQADLMYRGVVQLVNGSAQINIDTVSDMTDGTFASLNRCTQVFTTNESNWDAVRGSVTGNILTIESNTADSMACISWMVVGERCDQHMMDTDWTHSDGRVIVEPEKTE